MDAERPERHADAERRTIVELSFLTLQCGNACRDALHHKFPLHRLLSSRQ
ncbi:DUF1534 domain-containing protein [Pseudomonas syringae]|nr:DUF1534 domain-containing protein [Pseudomonas syringae]NAP22054.1 DUF1534 domain-containing protein [Pseudomonas syringae]NAP27004.1 DUF1534 domain-containing protein [Pseudomonas syringae]NAP52388.1 DUF1534 domain-containing protein [Pseudomonas syringae]NAP87226.1 DUF1534 domain-containing protein [Pseudomonas syringae]